MTYTDALEYLMGIPRFSKTLTLERIRFLLSALGNPQDHLKAVHIAGTNGKGSTTTMLSRILMASGYKVGTYISPFVEDFRERICVNGEFIDKNALAQLTQKVSELAQTMDETPNAFEQITAIALGYFHRAGCDIVCLEAGLGGRWDATNIIPPPLVSVITSIGLDHMQFLGDTPEKIAMEKCGIIKPGSTTVISPLQPENVVDLILKDCISKGVDAIVPDLSIVSGKRMDLGGTDFVYSGTDYHLKLHGEHQIANAITAIEAAKLLNGKGFTVSQESICSGVSSAHLPARLEIISESPLCIIDGAHNAPGMQALCSTIDSLCGDRKITAIMGCLQDKSAQQMAQMLASRCHALYCVMPDSPKACDPEELKAYADPYCQNTYAYSSLDQAIDHALSALSADSALFVCGSLYLAGPAKKALISRL